MQETIGENYENMLEEQDGADGTVSDSEYSPSNKRRKLAGRVNNNRKLRQIDVTNEDETIAAQESDNEDDLLQDQTCVPGRVCSVEMENFMCHEQLKLSFDIDHANCFFVGGANGSGKSALFAALNIGLGGKGSQNERGAALKGYIKEGTTRAKLRIVLSNTGHGAMPGYGSRIIVERVINVNGGGSYSIKTILGSGRAKREELISHKRQDLEKIMHRFGIQLANPIFWMSQDRCRQFLNVAKPEALFEIFAKATELEYTEEIYTKVEQIMCEVRSGINVLKQKSAATAEERESLMEMRKRHEGLQGKRCQLDELGWFLAWAPVKEAKQELEIVEAKKKAAEADIKQIADNILKYKHKQGEYAELKQQMHEKNEERQRDVVRVRAEQTEKISGKREYKQQLINLRIKKKEVRNDIRVREMNLERAKNNLVKYRDNAMQDERKRRYQQAKYKIEASKESIETLRAQRIQKKEERVQAQQEHEEVKAEYSRLQQDKSEATRRIGDINDYKKRVERMSRDELGRFGEHTKSILELIRSNANRFEKVPVGPIGMHVHVRDDQWAYAIEKATHDCLPAYVVDNQRDDKVFKQLIHQFLPNAPVSTIVTKFLPRHDVSRFAPEQRFLTIERMVKIDNDVAFNLLVDKCSIESAMLMDSDEDARRVMDGNCPQNIRQCYTLSGAKAQGRNSSGGFYRFFPDNSGGTSALYLKTSKKVDANRYDQELAQLSARIPQWEDTIITVRRQVSITEGHMREAEAELRRIEERIRENEETIRQNQGIVDTYDPEEDGDDPEENLKKAIETIERGIGERREVFQQIEDQENVLDAELEEANESLKELQARLDEMEDELRPFSERQQANEEKWRKLMVQIQTLEKKEQYLQETLAELDEQRVQQSRLYDNAHQLAEETSMELETPEGQTVPPDLDTLPDPRRVDRKYKLLENEINAVEKEMLSLEEVTERLARNDVVQKADVEVQQRLFKVSMALERALLVRKQKFPVMRHVITMRLKDTFSKFMTLRGMRGTVNVDFDRRVLEIPVKPKNQDRVIQDHKGLSGGERSYLTACFVMALWEIMESPFRCMDEFDVFMDSCNRKVIMDLIIQFATKTCQHSQFILFTPQGISELKVNPRVKIFEMKKVHSTS